MVKRKEQLKALLSGATDISQEPGVSGARAPETKAAETGAWDEGKDGGRDGGAASGTVPGGAGPGRTGSGAVRAVGLSLGSLTRDAQSARRLRDELAVADRVVSLDPAMIEPAPIADRLAGGGLGDDELQSLKRSIEQDGQAVPVLVRPHSDPLKAQNGLYQTAYGHRRIAAAAALGRKVKAVVRVMSDVELVIAQGRENAERRDLSYIERALFAFRMIQRGFERATAQAALGVDKTEMSRLIAVAESVPGFVAQAVGPAPKAGRQRWMEIGDGLKSEAGQAKAVDEIHSHVFLSLPSDERFRRLHARLTARRGKPARKRDGQVLRSPDGEAFAVLRGTTGAGGEVSIGLTGAGARGFAAFLAERLPQLHGVYRASASGTSGGEGAEAAGDDDGS